LWTEEGKEMRTDVLDSLTQHHLVEDLATSLSDETIEEL
jgi:hypothetical protein